MNPLDQEMNRTFLELVGAFETFRQAWERVMVSQRTVAPERLPTPPPAHPQPVNPPPRKGLLTRQEAAEYLGVKPQTLATWQLTRRYHLPVVKVGRSARYRLQDLERWLQSRTVGEPTD